MEQIRENVVNSFGRMKRTGKLGLLAVLLLSSNFWSCNGDETLSMIDSVKKNEEVKVLKPNKAKISRLIAWFDELMKKESIAGSVHPNNNIDKLPSLPIGGEDSKTKNSLNQINSYSSTFQSFSSEIMEMRSFSSKESYKKHLTDLDYKIGNSGISIEEKQLLIDDIFFMKTYVDWACDWLRKRIENKRDNSSHLTSNEAEDFSIWCAVSIAGNAAATVGLLTCVETAVWVAERL